LCILLVCSFLQLWKCTVQKPKCHCIFLIVSSPILLRMRNVKDKIFRENQNTHFMYYKRFFLKIMQFMKYYGMLRGRAGQAKDNMNLTCWITTAANNQWEYEIIFALPRQPLLGDHTPILNSTYFACLVIILQVLFRYMNVTWRFRFSQ